MVAPKGFFVTGTGTEVGKTVVSAALAHDLRQRGMSLKRPIELVARMKEGD